MQECVQDQKDYQDHSNHSREYPTRSQLQLLCQLHSEGARFIKARISLRRAHRKSITCRRGAYFLARPVETMFEEAAKGAMNTLGLRRKWSGRKIGTSNPLGPRVRSDSV